MSRRHPKPAEHMATVSAAFRTGPIPRAMFKSERNADLYAVAYAERVAEFATMTGVEVLAVLNRSVRARRKAAALAAINNARRVRLYREKVGGAA